MNLVATRNLYVKLRVTILCVCGLRFDSLSDQKVNLTKMDV